MKRDPPPRAKTKKYYNFFSKKIRKFMVPAWCHDDKESIDEKIKTIDALFDELSTNVTSQSERIQPGEVGGGLWQSS